MPDPSPEQAKAEKIKQFSAEFDRLIRSGPSASSRQPQPQPRPAARSRLSQSKPRPATSATGLLSAWLGLGLVALILALLVLLGYWIWTSQPALLWMLLLTIGLFSPGLCQIYGLIVGGFTVLMGVKWAFVVGQSFSVLPTLPFVILEPRLSYFYLGWGLLAASRKNRSGLGFGLALLNLLGGALGLFSVKSSTAITLPGFWGSMLSGLLTVGLGCSMANTILQSWQAQATDQP
ncbi:MAG: hypothetical protein ACKO7W_16630 [Elainella sp.]